MLSLTVCTALPPCQEMLEGVLIYVDLVVDIVESLQMNKTEVSCLESGC
jgi:hypothetical protein